MPLTSGTELKAQGLGKSVLVDKLLGSGGQGEVYRVTVEGKPYALKWYFPALSDEKQRKVITNLIQLVRAKPNLMNDSRFIFPIDMVEGGQWPKQFGYLMNLLDGSQFPSVNDIMTGKRKPSFSLRCEVAMELCDAFQNLHTNGLVYADISFANIHFSPTSGKIRIIDNDNVVVNGETVQIAGTQGFKAPEIVRGEQRSPNVQTDKYSLAVFLFYIFFQAHPLEGELEANIAIFDLPAQRKIYGTDATFIYDPQNASNRPVKGCHDSAIFYWNLYPEWFKDVFTRAFTEGLQHTDRRVEPSEWKRVFVRLKDSIVRTRTGAENFYDPAKVRTGNTLVCWHTNEPVQLPPRLRIGADIVVLQKGQQLFAHHIKTGAAFQFGTPLAEVVESPTNPDVLGLKNLTDTDWKIRTAANEERDVPPGKSAALKNGTTIEFGGKTGQIAV